MSRDGRICVVARARALPDKLGEVEEVLAPLIEQTRQEPGCIRYELWQSADDPTDFALLEEWASESALADHLSAEHVQAIGFQLGDLVTGAPEVLRYSKLL